VHLVEDRVGHRLSRATIVAPVKISGDQQRPRDVWRRVLTVWPTRVVCNMPVDRGMPVDFADNRPRVRVEQQFGRVAAYPRCRVPRAIYPKAVTLPEPRIG